MAAPRACSPWTALVLLSLLAGPQIPVQGQVQPQPSFQQDKFLGVWFTSGLASNATWFLEKKAKMSMCKSVVAETTDGALNLTITYFRKTQCHTWNLQLEPSAPPGHYTHTSLKWGDSRDVWVVETDYSQYALLYTQSTGAGRDFSMATLYTRSQSPATEALKRKFTAFVETQGFTDESIVFLSRADDCID